MGNDYDTGHGLPSDFPSDPSYGLYFWIGGLLTALLIALVAAAIIGFLRGHSSRRTANFEDWPHRIARFVKRKSEEVVRPAHAEQRQSVPVEGIWAVLFGGGRPAEASVRRHARDIDEGLAEKVTGIVRSLIGCNLALGKEMSAEIKALTEALEGYKDIKDAAPGAPVPQAGGTVINIAVNPASSEAAQLLPGPYASAASVVQAAPQLFESRALSREANIKLAFDKFREDWMNPDVAAAQLKAAQIALCTRPPEPPRPA